MKKTITVKAPTKTELITLRLMIFLGVVSMWFFLDTMLSHAVRGNAVLYWMLVTTFVFGGLKILHEWTHYFFITVPKTPPLTKTYSVDIFTTFCAGEPIQMIEETLTALQAITYPHKTYLCDEADDPYLRELCKQLGVYHVTRTVKINAKAGNINNALGQSDGELCVVLDPDHVPFPDFLDPIVSHFNNPEVGFVQIVQAYKNHNEGLIAKGAAQQTYQFYGPMMMTMNKYGTVQAIGANCTFRRTALESIGGHAAGLAEDMHTSMHLHAKGWKSVYVPAVLARGLVPSTLSAYYQQQLKWSRGVFDLLVIAYPKLFKQFTWQQKLHYAFIPLHYVSGLIFLINFLIPVIALFFNESPVYLNLFEFGLVLLPLSAAIILIRHYVQWWVMEDEERGFHVVGGLLMIGTWWIFITGLVYTILRKKVPYVPTPKEGNEDTSWILNLPNAVILILSLTAISYGLSTDWNPYNLAMAGFASMNCFFMVFVIAASRQHHVQKWGLRYKLLSDSMKRIREFKGYFWILRRRIYAGVRSMALLISTMLLCTLVYFNNSGNDIERPNLKFADKNAPFLLGTHLTGNKNPGDLIKNIRAFQTSEKVGFDLIALDLPWGENLENPSNALQSMDSIYANGSIPLIKWRLDKNLYSKSKTPIAAQTDFAHRIIDGRHDAYLTIFSDRIRSLRRPVYIRFETELANSQPAEFKAAWKYVFDFFENHGVYNLIRVWQVPQNENPEHYFPGKQYVDWIAVLSPGDISRKKSLTDLGLPLMIVQPDSTVQDKFWLKNTLADAKKVSMPIGGIVLSGTSIDSTSGNDLRKYLGQKQFSNNRETPTLLALSLPQNPPTKEKIKVSFLHIKGINYTKGQDWTKSLRVFTKDELTRDLAEIKALGVNTLKHYGPGIYDRNILKSANEADMKIHYGFWIPVDIDFRKDTDQLAEITSDILKTIEDHKDDKNITAWNMGNPVMQALQNNHRKPELIYQQDAYLLWLRKLVDNIKKTDPNRPVTVDVAATDNLPYVVKRLNDIAPQIDAFGLVMKDRPVSVAQLKRLNVPYFISYTEVVDYEKLTNKHAGVFISNWQDEQLTDRVQLDGIKDFTGRKKLSFLKLKNKWHVTGPLPGVPLVKILKPAAGTFAGTELVYNALIRKNGQWMLASSVASGLTYEWKLIRTDGFDNAVALDEVGNGARLTLKIPKNAAEYRLHLYVIKDKTIIATCKSTLNTPLTMTENIE